MSNLQNQEAEQGLLGALLIDNRAFDHIADIVQADHFAYPAHQRIFEKIKAIINGGSRVTPVTLKNSFANDEDLVNVGGSEYLAELAAGVLTSYNAPDYARQVRGLFTRREILGFGDYLSGAVNDFDKTDQDLLAEIDQRFTEITEHRASQSVSAAQAAGAAIDWMQGIANGTIRPIKTHIEELDQAIGGFYPGRLYVLAGRPGMGKTAAAVTMADNIALDTPVLFVSLEMPAQELAMRLIAWRTGISIQEQEDARDWPRDKWDAVSRARQQIKQIKLTIEDAYAADLSAIRALARKHKRRHGQFVLFIDHLGLMGFDRNIKQRVHQIEEITKSLKSLSKELDIPVVLLCQLSRAVESREDKRPMLSDLRDSGSIEQDADCVMFAFREEYYAQGEEPKQLPAEGADKFGSRYREWEDHMNAVRGKADIIIAKIRQRRPGTVRLKFDGVRQRFI